VEVGKGDPGLRGDALTPEWYRKVFEEAVPEMVKHGR
jgi:hypothetical protein